MPQANDIELEPRKFVAPEYIFGLNARHLATGYCKKLGAKKVMIVTDIGLQKTPWYIELKKSLNDKQINHIVFSNVSPNPRDEEVMLGTDMYQKENCNMLLALGGGSVIDCAKGIGIVATNKNPINKFEGIDKIKAPIPPLICIPTTAGASADVSQFAIINNNANRYKMAIISKALVPDVALIDPEVLLTMGQILTANTGMDALCHAFEAFVSNAASAFTNLFALEAISLLSENLVNSVYNSNDMQIKGKTMLASLYAGLAFSNASLGCTHSLAHSLGGYLDLPHGECNAILLPHVISYNFPFAADKYKIIASKMGINCNKKSSLTIKKLLVNRLITMKKDLNITNTLKDKGVNYDIIDTLSKKAILDPCNATNPRTPSEDDLKTIYLEAL
ncbi:MAG: iron-containing alcohol dehydrogenase [Marinilabiliaceae bacterium]|nr:iron-containing alcohol dehydrogenase [Marinilabiliaceae bacterium]